MWYVYVLSTAGNLHHYDPEAVNVPSIPPNASGTLYLLGFPSQQARVGDKIMNDQTPPDLYRILFSLIIPEGM